MKPFICAGILLVALTACAAQPADTELPNPNTVEEPAAAELQTQETVPVPEENQKPALPPDPSAVENPVEPPEPQEPEKKPEKEPAGESQKPEGLGLPALQLPLEFYCYGDTAVDRSGQVVLQMPGHALTALVEERSGQVGGILARPTGSQGTMTLFDLSGQPLLQGLPESEVCRLWGDLLWCGEHSSFSLWSISQRKCLKEDQAVIEPAGEYLAVQPAFWNSPCLLLSSNGETQVQLERGFRLQKVVRQGSESFLVMASRDGQENLADLTGKPVLPSFHNQVVGVDRGCALVRDGQKWQALSLQEGKAVFHWSAPFVLLDGGALVEDKDGFGYRLVDRSGEDRIGLLLEEARTTANGWVLGKIKRDGVYGVVLLDGQGKERYFMEAELSDVSLLDENTAFYARPTGKEGGFWQEGILVDLEKGQEALLLEGRFLQSRVVKTSQGPVVLVSGRDGQENPQAWALQADGTFLLDKVEWCAYAGGDVFQWNGGLLTTAGEELYRA